MAEIINLPGLCGSVARHTLRKKVPPAGPAATAGATASLERPSEHGNDDRTVTVGSLAIFAATARERVQCLVLPPPAAWRPKGDKFKVEFVPQRGDKNKLGTFPNGSWWSPPLVGGRPHHDPEENLKVELVPAQREPWARNVSTRTYRTRKLRKGFSQRAP